MLLADWVPREIVHQVVKSVGLYATMTALIVAAEHAAGKPVSRYFSRAHSQQFFWYLLKHIDGTNLILFSWVYAAIYHNLGFLNLHLLDDKPWALRFLLVYLSSDLLFYWIHRLLHAVPWLWTFHAVHHASETLTPAQTGQAHPIDDFFVVVFGTVLNMVLGTEPTMWVGAALLRTFLSLLQHTELDWRFGPLYYVFVSPAFHRTHHAKATEFQNRNFGQQMSTWDFIFGTASSSRVVPTAYGVENVVMPTIASQVIGPFRTLYRDWFSRARAQRDFQ